MNVGCHRRSATGVEEGVKEDEVRLSSDAPLDFSELGSEREEIELRAHVATAVSNPSGRGVVT